MYEVASTHREAAEDTSPWTWEVMGQWATFFALQAIGLLLQPNILFPLWALLFSIQSPQFWPWLDLVKMLGSAKMIFLVFLSGVSLFKCQSWSCSKWAIITVDEWYSMKGRYWLAIVNYAVIFCTRQYLIFLQSCQSIWWHLEVLLCWTESKKCLKKGFRSDHDICCSVYESHAHDRGRLVC